jgi:hypothetical protein
MPTVEESIICLVLEGLFLELLFSMSLYIKITILKDLLVIYAQLAGMGLGEENMSVSALAFCSTTLNLAVGDECGLVRFFIYFLCFR